MTSPLLRFALLTLALAACDFADPCDQGQLYQGHLCYDVPIDAAPGPDVATVPKAFGDSCMESTECGGLTDFCAAQPGQVGYCTRTNCIAEPALCPSGWGCLDLAVFLPTLPAICTLP